jgi:hypothetical protein
MGFKKYDLKSGMLVDILHFGTKETYLVVRDTCIGKDMLVCDDGWIALNSYDNDLHSTLGDFEIVTIYSPKSGGGWTWNKENSMWKRIEITQLPEPVELTQKEIEEKLGYSIKIKEEVKETKSGKVKYKIIDIGKGDAFYCDKEYLIGQVVESENVGSCPEHDGWQMGDFTFEKPVEYPDGETMDWTCFYRVKLEEIRE